MDFGLLSQVPVPVCWFRASPQRPMPAPLLQRLASSVESLATRIRSAHPEINPRNPWKEKHVGSTVNLKQSRAHAQYKNLRPHRLPTRWATGRYGRSRSTIPTVLEHASAPPLPELPSGPPLKTTAALQEIVDGLLAWADAWDRRMVPLTKFKHVFAERLVDLGLKPEQLLWRWDASSSGKSIHAEAQTRDALCCLRLPLPRSPVPVPRSSPLRAGSQRRRVPHAGAPVARLHE